MSKKKLDPVVPKDEEMSGAFNRILNADKYIVITVNQEANGMETSRIQQGETSDAYTANELEFWRDIFHGKIQAEQALKNILDENDIKDQ